MKFSRIFNSFRVAGRRATRLIKNPFHYFWVRGSLRFRQKFLSAEIPGTSSRRGTGTKDRKRTSHNRVQNTLGRFGSSFNRRFGGSESEESTTLAYRDASSELRRRPYDPRFETDRRIGFAPSDTVVLAPAPPVEIPALVANQEIRGRRGRYRCIGEALIENKKFRVYPGVHSSTNERVLIKEYLLPESKYNREERRIRKRHFASIVDTNFKSPSGTDFRVVVPLETISPPRERRCYLVTELSDRSTTLRQYVESHQALSPKEVVKFLDQALQSLWFLHTHRLRNTSGKIQNGTPHGNLSLDSILIEQKESQSEDDETQLCVRLSDLALWEHIFRTPNSPIAYTSYAQDLIDLGSICASLLLGKNETDDKNWFLDCEEGEENWLAKDEVLGCFLLKLLQINGKFESAQAARQELLRIEREGGFDYQQELLPSALEETEPNSKNRKALWIAIGATALLSALIGASLIIVNRQFSARNTDKSVPCCIAKVNPPQGNHSYAVESGIWNYVLERSGFMSKNKNLREELEARQPILENYGYQGVSKNAIAQLEKGDVDFVLSHWDDDLPSDLEQEVVAYHGLTAFVAFSDDYRKENIPNALKGKISLKDLRTFYTRGIEEWKQPRKLQDWDVKLYVPFEPEAIALFKDLLFKDVDNSGADERKFVRLTDEILARQRREIPSSKNYLPTTRSVVENVFLDYERNKTISIGFGYFNSIYGQCSVYPLSIKKRWKAIQPYATSEGDSITPKMDLCNDKGGYAPNAEAFSTQEYPLGYSLVVVYPKDEKRSAVGKQFAKLLKTEESQYLLEEAGIIPLKYEQ